MLASVPCHPPESATHQDRRADVFGRHLSLALTVSCLDERRVGLTVSRLPVHSSPPEAQREEARRWASGGMLA